MSNLSLFLDNQYNTCPNRIAINFNSVEDWTYARLYQAVNALGAALNRLNLKKGDRIAIAFHNSPEFVISYLACLRAGYVVVTLNIMLQAIELEYQLKDSGARCLLANKRMVKIFTQLEKGTTEVDHVVCGDRDEDQKIFWDGLEVKDYEPCPLEEKADDDVAQLSYTAAMDGYPRGAMLTHGSLWANCRMNSIGMGMTDQDSYLSAIPLFHTYGAMSNCLAPLATGAKVYLQQRFNPKDFLEALQEHKITVVIGVPTLFAALIFYENFSPEYFRSTRLVISGAAKLPLAITKKYQKAGIELREGYGLTECSPAVAVNPHNGPNKFTSIGLPLVDVQLKVVDPQGNQLGPDQEGELLVKGPLVMKGYWNDPELTRTTIEADGWLHTGDKARFDDDGYYYITGLLKDMLITGGFNVYPKEVERLLESHPSIQKISIVGVPDLIQGEIVKAIVTMKKGETMTEREFAHFAKRTIALYKVPRLIEFVS